MIFQNFAALNDAEKWCQLRCTADVTFCQFKAVRPPCHRILTRVGTFLWVYRLILHSLGGPGYVAVYWTWLLPVCAQPTLCCISAVLPTLCRTHRVRYNSLLSPLLLGFLLFLFAVSRSSKNSHLYAISALHDFPRVWGWARNLPHSNPLFAINAWCLQWEIA